MRSYSKINRQKIQKHILKHYAERGVQGLKEDFNAVKYNDLSDNQAAKHLVEGANFLIYSGDQRDFIDSLNITDTNKQYTDQQVFEKYVALLAREIVHLVKKA